MDTPSGRPLALGRPVDPIHPLTVTLTVYSGSSQKPCSECDRPTWFGPRLTARIDNGELTPLCGDCVILSMAAGALPGAVVCLGNPEVKRP